uniref:Uncharacterized protein n=1 Tax=Oryza glumipatula TaxID=40148 RepID=A0A0D9YNJ4_9ORYZ
MATPPLRRGAPTSFIQAVNLVVRFFLESEQPNIPGLTLAESVKSGIRKRHAEAYLVVLIPQPLDHLAASPSCRRERRRLRRRDAFAGIPTKPPSPSRRAPLCQPRYAAACLGRGVSPPRLGPSCSQSSAAAAEN